MEEDDQGLCNNVTCHVMTMDEALRAYLIGPRSWHIFVTNNHATMVFNATHIEYVLPSYEGVEVEAMAFEPVDLKLP